MIKIKKYPIKPLQDAQIILMHKGADILSFGANNENDMFFFAAEDDRAPLEEKELWCVETGAAPFLSNTTFDIYYYFVNTVTIKDKSWHLFAKEKGQF
jgi:hypothetical protein